MEIEVFEEQQGWAFRVGNIYQPYDPEADGFTPMSEARAMECAQATLKRLQG